ncbi:hypothetical protein CHARACLAT_009356 [Characodon lateralis]|uniref:Uncharacterized protein n=1 Tax=Characodon lateralis TaxID=208331 RepID=A0ABU7D8C6_9TELE|nr:hypothetical protein [Characodon lateralis]
MLFGGKRTHQPKRTIHTLNVMMAAPWCGEASLQQEMEAGLVGESLNSTTMCQFSFNPVYLYSANSQHMSSQGSSQSQVHTFQLIVIIEQFSQIQLFIQIG